MLTAAVASVGDDGVVADAGHLGGCQRVGQAAEQDTVGGQLEQTLIDAHDDAPTGEVVADGMLSAG